MSLKDALGQLGDSLLEWIKPLSDKVQSHEVRLSSLSELTLRRHQTLESKVDRLSELSQQANTDRRSEIGSLDQRLGALSADHAQLSATVAKLEARVSQGSGSQGPGPSPTPDPRPVPGPTPDPATGPSSDPADPADPVTYDSTVAISVKNYSSVLAPKGSYVTAAVPVPRSANILDANQFSLCSFPFVLSSSQNPAHIRRSSLVPCDVRVTARWDSAKSSTQPDSPIRWILITFAIDRDIAPGVTYSYELLIGADQPAPDDAVDVIKRDDDSGFDILVGLNTHFSVTYTGLFAFDDRNGTVTLSSYGVSTNLSPTVESALSRLDNQTLTPRSISIEYQGPLTAIIVVEGTLSYPFNKYPGPISIRRRYQFYANSPTVHITESLTFEGTFNGGSHERPQDPSNPSGAKWNAILGTLFRESFKIHTHGSSTSGTGTSVTASALPTVTVLDTVVDPPFMDSSGKRVSLTQHLRDSRLTLDSSGKKQLNPTRYELLSGGDGTKSTFASLDSGPEADGGLISVSTPAGAVTAALRHMHRYEPQSLSFDPATSTLNIDLASDRFRLAHHQGLFVEYSITVSSVSQPNLLSIWRDLNTPLIGLVSPEWINTSGATWNGIPDVDYSRPPIHGYDVQYDKCVSAIIDSTLRKRAAEGMQGLLTWGLYPQYWGEWADFSPGGLGSGLKSWDQTYTESTFTDYWNTTRLAVEGAIALSDPSWINEITYPAALRMLYTQIVQGPPFTSLDTDEREKIGTATYGYSLYRSDGNSSHQYWENLMWYYYLTGDYTVISIIERGARVQLRRFKSGTPITGRQPMQWMSVFAFLDGVSRSTDIDWNAEFVALMTRSIQEHYLSGPVFDPTIPDGRTSSANTIPYAAVWLEDRNKLTASDTTSLYSFAYYDAEMIYQLLLRTNNAPIKIDAHNHTPTEILINLARTVSTYGFSLLSTPLYDVSGNWARVFRVTYDRASARFTAFSTGLQSGNELLYPDDKPALAAFLSRAARLSKDPAIVSTARNLLAYSFERILGKAAASGAPNAQLRDVPMSKLMGLCTGRLGTGVLEMMKLEEELAGMSTAAATATGTTETRK